MRDVPKIEQPEDWPTILGGSPALSDWSSSDQQSEWHVPPSAPSGRHGRGAREGTEEEEGGDDDPEEQDAGEPRGGQELESTEQ